MKVKFRTVFWILAVALVAALLVFAFRPQPVPVDVARTTRGPMVVTVRDEGRTRVQEEYVVSAPVAGWLLRVEPEPGEHVHAGETVARVLPAEPAFLDARAQAEAEAAARSAESALSATAAELERAQAQLDYARAELERIERLRERDLASAEALDRARLELRSAEAGAEAAQESVAIRRAELDAARSRLMQPDADGSNGASVAVRAPVDGRVLRVMQESESVIAAGADILALGDPGELEIVLEMLSTEAIEVEPGAAVIIDNYGRNEESLRGRVRVVEPFGFTEVSALGVEEQRVNVIVDFVGPPEERAMLAHGYRVEGAVVTWSADDVLRVPVAALFRSGERWAVFRVEDGAAQLTPVEIGHDNGEHAEVLDGLEAGETVVLYPGERLADGVRVRRRE